MNVLKFYICAFICQTISTLVTRVKVICKFPSESEADRIISGLRWIGLFSTGNAESRSGNLLDTLCARLETLMKYGQGERDLVMLQHKFVVEWKDGKEVSNVEIATLLVLNFIFRTSLLPPWRRTATLPDTQLWL